MWLFCLLRYFRNEKERAGSSQACKCYSFEKQSTENCSSFFPRCETCPKNLHQTSLSHTQSKQNSKKRGFSVFYENECAGSEKHARRHSLR